VPLQLLTVATLVLEHEFPAGYTTIFTNVIVECTV